MKFDVRRALDRIRELPDPRREAADASGVAPGWIAERLGGAGLEVETRTVDEPRFPDLVAARLGWACLGLLAAGVSLLNLRSPRWDRGGKAAYALAAVAALTWCWAFAATRFRLGNSRFPRNTVRDIWARPKVSQAPVRVVFVGFTRPADRRWPGFVRFLLLVVLLVALGVSSFVSPGAPYRAIVGFSLVALELSSTLLLVREPFHGEPEFDHRAGLVLLAGLAEGWSRRAHDRVEAWFVALAANNPTLPIPFRGLESASQRAFRQSLAAEPIAKPTLVVRFFDPGRGAGIRLVGPEGDALQVAEQAADDHWIPHAVSVAGQALPEHRPDEVFPVVGLASEPSPPGAGGPSDPPSERVEGVDPGLLAASAQLAAEIALRWAKRCEAQEESRPRSSQKPG